MIKFQTTAKGFCSGNKGKQKHQIYITLLNTCMQSNIPTGQPLRPLTHMLNNLP